MSKTPVKPVFIDHGDAFEAAKHLNTWFNGATIGGPAWGKLGVPARLLRATLDHILVAESEEARLHSVHEVNPMRLKERLDLTDLTSRTLQTSELTKFFSLQREQLENYARELGQTACPWLEVAGIKGGRPAGSGGAIGQTSIRLRVGWVALREQQAVDDGEPTATEDGTQQEAAEGEAQPSSSGGETGLSVVACAEAQESQAPGITEVGDLPANAARSTSYSVHYSIENAKRWLLGRWLFPEERMPTNCLQWRLYKWTTFSYMIGGLLLGIFALVVMYYGTGLALKDYFQLAAVLAIGWGVVWWRTDDSMARLMDDRIVIATEWWAGFDESSQVEMIRTDGKTSHVQLVRYTANCSICGSKVEVLDGKREFPRRLVGRCTESPREHVFSFDRVTRTGFPLRRPPPN